MAESTIYSTYGERKRGGEREGEREKGREREREREKGHFHAGVFIRLFKIEFPWFLLDRIILKCVSDTE